ncbi:MAG: efp [Parachlamydiales bacterium]|nr:efp [Parachlamydiales bacterium]
MSRDLDIGFLVGVYSQVIDLTDIANFETQIGQAKSLIKKVEFMAQVSTNELKVGMKVEVDREPYLVSINEFVKPGKGQAFNRVKMKNMISGRVVERTYKSGDKLDLADIEEAEVRYLYKDADGANFMDEKTFDQLSISKELLGPNEQWLKEETIYHVVFYNGSAIELLPPTFMEFTIVETAPGVRGDTASGRVLKAAILENGSKIQVPIFIEQGEKIKVDTRTCEYVSRVS